LVSTIIGFTSVVTEGTTSWKWDLDTAAQNNGILSTTGTNKTDNNTLNVDLSAFADTGGNNDLVLEKSGDLLKYGNSWGMKNQDNESGSPEHTFDNATNINESGLSGQRLKNGNCYTRNKYGKWKVLQGPATIKIETDYDMALVSFDTLVELKEVGFGWVNGSYTDFTVLAYTGASATGPKLQDNTWAGIASEWTLVGSYRAASAGYYGINAGNVASEYWLVGAFNDILDTHYHDGHSTDAFKIKGLVGNTPEEVPEPAALGLMLLGLFGLYVHRNKARK
jgi:hypothetical protein